MSVFGKLFRKKQEQKQEEKPDFGKTLSELIGCGYERLPSGLDGKKLAEIYLSEFEKCRGTGMFPVIAALSSELCDIISFSEDCRKDEPDDAESFLRERYEERISDCEDKESFYGKYTGEEKPVNCFLFTDDEELGLFRVPAREPWEIFEQFPFGGWNDCPEPKELIAISRYWHEKYRAVPAVITGDCLEYYVFSPVRTDEDAIKLAEEQYGFCTDAVEQGTETVAALAGTLKNSAVWSFWWD